MEENGAAQHSEEKKHDVEPLGEKTIDVHRNEGHADDKERQENVKRVSDGENDVGKQRTNKADTLRLDDSANSASTSDSSEDKKTVLHVGPVASGVKGTGVTPETCNSGDIGTAGQSRYSMEGKPPNPDTEFVTVIFHALLTPTFQFNPRQGDKIFIRGSFPFTWKDPGRQVAVHIVR